MGNDLQKQWVFDNVLFLDPNLPPFTSNEAEEYDNDNKREDDKSEYINLQRKNSDKVEETKKKLKINIPMKSKVRGRLYEITIEINGKESQFKIICKNEPRMVLLLCDVKGDPLRELNVSLLRQVERVNEIVKLSFFRDKETGAVMQFKFKEINECQDFCNTLKLMYGIYVYEYGVRKTANDKNVKEKTTKVLYTCPIHMDSNCNCNLVDETINIDNAIVSYEYPISLPLYPMINQKVIFQDIKKCKAKKQLVQWYISMNFGGILPSFALSPVSVQNNYIPTEYDIGYCIQCKVYRNIHNKIYLSTTTSGPVALDEEMAGYVLHTIQNSESINFHVQFIRSEIVNMNPVARSYHEEYIEGIISIEWSHLLLGLLDYDDTLNYNSFSISRYRDLSTSQDDDIYVILTFNKQRIHIACSNYIERNIIFHSIMFHKLRHIEESVFGDFFSIHWTAKQFALTFAELYNKINSNDVVSEMLSSAGSTTNM